MESKILVNIGTDHAFECATRVIGRSGEGDSSKLEINIPDRLVGCSVYLDFEMPSGEKLRTPKLEIENGVAIYRVSQYLLTEKGDLKVQLVLVNESGAIWKSFKKSFIIQKSINAEDEIPIKEDFFTEAQKVIAELNQEVAEIAEALSNNSKFASMVAMSIEEATSVKTITGSRLKFFVGTQAEYNRLADKENLFAIITDDPESDKFSDLEKILDGSYAVKSASGAPDMGTHIDDYEENLGKAFEFYNTNGFGVNDPQTKGYFKVWAIWNSADGCSYCGLLPSTSAKQILGSENNSFREIHSNKFISNGVPMGRRLLWSGSKTITKEQGADIANIANLSGAKFIVFELNDCGDERRTMPVKIPYRDFANIGDYSSVAISIRDGLTMNAYTWGVVGDDNLFSLSLSLVSDFSPTITITKIYEEF